MARKEKTKGSKETPGKATGKKAQAKAKAKPNAKVQAEARGGEALPPPHFHRDAQGDPRAEVPEGQAGLAGLCGFLESDLQGSIAACDRLLGILDRVAAGAVAGYERTGNAFRLVLTPEGASLVPLATGAVAGCQVPLDRFREMVAAWRAFLLGTAPET